MKNKILISVLGLFFLFTNNVFAWWNNTQYISTTNNKTTLDAPIDSKIYLLILLGIALVYFAYRKLKKA